MVTSWAVMIVTLLLANAANWHPVPCDTPAAFSVHISCCYSCFVPSPLCIKSHCALSAFLMYLKIRREGRWRCCSPAPPPWPRADVARLRTATRFNPGTRIFHYRPSVESGVDGQDAQSCEAAHLMVHFTGGGAQTSGATSGERGSGQRGHGEGQKNKQTNKQGSKGQLQGSKASSIDGGSSGVTDTF